MTLSTLTSDAIQLLKSLIETPSFSGEEDQTASLITLWLAEKGIQTERRQNNVIARNLHFDPTKSTILLNSHHDTVKPNTAYTRHPFAASVEGDTLYGLGSNDAGGPLVALLATFVWFYDRKDLQYNFIIVASAEEENSGPNGLNSVLSFLPEPAFAIVGEPTQMQLAIAEKGLLVLDCYAHGQAGHAAHGLGENAIYKAVKAIDWFRTFEFPKVSETLGKMRMTVTQIEAGNQHNVIPATCKFVVDVRVTDAYSNTEVLEIIKQHVEVEVQARSLRLNSSSIPQTHPIVQAGIALGRQTYGSPTLSDQAVLSCPSLKLGPGDSHRSHSADEYILLSEIEQAVALYTKLLSEVVF